MTALTRIASVGAAATLVAVIGLSAGAQATTVSTPSITPIAACTMTVNDITPLCGHHYPNS